MRQKSHDSLTFFESANLFIIIIAIIILQYSKHSLLGLLLSQSS